MCEFSIEQMSSKHVRFMVEEIIQDIVQVLYASARVTVTVLDWRSHTTERLK